MASNNNKIPKHFLSDLTKTLSALHTPKNATYLKRKIIDNFDPDSEIEVSRFGIVQYGSSKKGMDKVVINTFTPVNSSLTEKDMIDVLHNGIKKREKHTTAFYFCQKTLKMKWNKNEEITEVMKELRKDVRNKKENPGLKVWREPRPVVMNGKALYALHIHTGGTLGEWDILAKMIDRLVLGRTLWFYSEMNRDMVANYINDVEAQNLD